MSIAIVCALAVVVVACLGALTSVKLASMFLTHDRAEQIKGIEEAQEALALASKQMRKDLNSLLSQKMLGAPSPRAIARR